MKNGPVFFWLGKRLRKRIPVILLLTGAGAGHALFGVLFALGTRQVIDSAVSGDRTGFWGACLLQLGIILGILLCQTLQRHLSEWLSARLDRDWKESLLHALLRGDYAEVSRYHSAELINRMHNDVRVLDEGILQILPSLASMITRLAAAFAILYAMAPVFSLLLLGVGILAVGLTALVRRRLKELHKQVSQEDGRVSGFFQEILEKLLMVQALDASKEVERRADQMLNDRFLVQRKRKNVALAANTGVGVMYYGAGFGALVWCAFGLLRGSMSFGSMTAVIQLVNQLQTPFVNLSGVIPKYIAMVAAAERLMELDLLTPKDQEAMLEPEAVYRELKALRAEQLSFSYDQEPILRNVSFFLPKGSFAVITGHSGIGKSTMLKLLLGVFRPQEGNLYLECESGRIPVNAASRRLFAYVPQGNLLLSGTLQDNLLLTKPDATPEEIAHAVYASDMEEFLPQLPDGLDTVLGENGAGLSEGQAQRLAIARAVLGGAPILLLDEATSALDEETEQKVLERLRQLPGKTCIAVTHRPAAQKLADWKIEVWENTLICHRIS